MIHLVQAKTNWSYKVRVSADQTAGKNHFITPTNAHNVNHVELLKHIEVMEAAPTCFCLQRNNHQGATANT